ncbi:fatty acyl-CoA reductase wat-like [Drosophila innubila]|uniref:fatty acyl-CoA reductase wat-like n=1 Tax=Drosophila innubila TaxID=198719 RepID=UPI00148D0CFD|nr:fatty acyl-CoA reductase wat-like [Drosophila innubila]XP_034488537.1 fatty acyl-CoA reductase wat-like [Drosophila innubila]
MVSQIQSFYKNKNVFITGGSGFLGRVIIEKLLRSTEVNRIYVLLRPKKGVSIKDRIASWSTDPVFSELLKSKPKYSDQIVAIEGDCGFPDLGISVEDRKLLVGQVQIVLHCAATVRFDEPLNVALDINTRGTLLVVQLAKEMRRLEAIVHVSTAFSNCVLPHIKEVYYPDNLSCTFDKILALREMLSNDLIDNMSPVLLGQFPNTYTFTKALAEQVVQKEASGLPACIFRPGMILGTFREPIPGWIDNLYGPLSILLGCAVGVLRVMIVDVYTQANVGPVDYCANMVLSTAWKTALENVQRKEKLSDKLPLRDPIIYNYAVSEKNPVKWSKFYKTVEDERYTLALEQMIWYPFLHTCTKLWAFELATLVYHILPGHFIDMVLRLRRQKPRMVKMYDKIHKHIKTVYWFTVRHWTFDMSNTDQLIQCFSMEDRKLFECDMNSLNWNEYFKVALFGAREYIANEKPTEESFRKAQIIMKRFRIYHRILQTVVCILVAALIWFLLRVIVG